MKHPDALNNLGKALDAVGKAPVSTPLDWAEVARIKDPATFNIKNFAKRVKQKDPWADFFRQKQSLGAALSGLERLAR